jgi:hypothetical protein
MTSHTGRSRLWRARVAVLLLAVIPAVLFVFLVSYGQSASAQTPIARAWRINSFGQLGDDSFAPRSKQVEVKGEGGTGTLGNVTSLDGGQNHTLALKDGTAYAWGHNGLGQLGTGPTSGTGTDSDVPVKMHGAGDVGFLTDVVAIAAGSSHSLAVKSDGTVWAWGYDGFGQLGDSASHSGDLSRIPVQVEGVGGSGFLTDVSSVAGGGLHSLALKKGTKTIGATVSYVEDSQSGPYKAILKPNKPLKPGVTYMATLTTAATDPAGNQLEQDPNPNAPAGVAKTWKFRVKS